MLSLAFTFLSSDLSFYYYIFLLFFAHRITIVIIIFGYRKEGFVDNLLVLRPHLKHPGYGAETTSLLLQASFQGQML